MRYCLFFILLLSGCCQFSSEDFAFAPEYRALFAGYEAGDTLWFASASGELDTAVIQGMNKFQSCGGVKDKGLPRSYKALTIQHLPRNNWTALTEMGYHREAIELDQQLLVVEKGLSKPAASQYDVSIEYRDFAGSLNVNTELRQDDQYQALGISEYWVLATELDDFQQTPESVIEVCWSKELGLTGYRKLNGASYSLINH